MARCRMLSEAIMRSEIYLSMTLGAQILYVQLCVEADDEGFVGSAQRTVRLLGVKKASLKELIDNKFLLVFEKSGVSVIAHWCIHNKIKKNRIRDTIYQEERSKIFLNKQNIYEIGSQTLENPQKDTPSAKTKTRTKSGQKVGQNLDNLSDQVKSSEVKSSEEKSSEVSVSQVNGDERSMEVRDNVATIQELQGLCDLEMDTTPIYSLDEYKSALRARSNSSWAQKFIQTLSMLHRHYTRLIKGAYVDFDNMSSTHGQIIKQDYTEEELSSIFRNITDIDWDKEVI